MGEPTRSERAKQRLGGYAKGNLLLSRDKVKKKVIVKILRL